MKAALAVMLQAMLIKGHDSSVLALVAQGTYSVTRADAYMHACMYFDAQTVPFEAAAAAAAQQNDAAGLEVLGPT